jgi:hypothetical protein
MSAGKVLGDEGALNSADVSWPSLSNSQQSAIRRQLEEILSHPVLRNSKRYAAVLRYVVERTLSGCEGELKERTIGIEVFGRSPDYDTANDHVVRSAMAEIRKRLAQYYREDGSAAEVKIDIQPGSYVPHFKWAGPQAVVRATEPDSEHRVENATVRPSHLSSKLAYAACAVLAMVLAVVLSSWKYKEDPLQVFWSPVLSARGPVLLCVGTLHSGLESTGAHANMSAPMTLSDFHDTDTEMVHVYDAIAFAKLAGLLEGDGKAYHLESQSDANFSDLQSGPAVLVGLMNNDWTERLVSNLRFTVQKMPGNAVLRIRDRINPNNNDWAIDYNAPYLTVTKDYALILRMRDPKTEQMVVVAAGLSVFGTSAAAKFLTSATDMKKLATIAPKAWESKSMELVLSTDVIRGRAGHGTIIASQFW